MKVFGVNIVGKALIRQQEPLILLRQQKQTLLSQQLYLTLIIDSLQMTSFQCSSSLNDLSSFGPRRSDRKRTKKIYKDDFMLPNPFKGNLKKHRGLRLPQILGSQIRRIEFLTEKTLSTLSYGKQEFNIQMLNDMKFAVNQQQLKLSEFLSIKLTAQKNVEENQIHLNFSKMSKINQQKSNTPKIQSNTITGEFYQSQELNKQVMGIATEEEICRQFWQNEMQEEDSISSFRDDKDFYLALAPRLRKESSKLLSDNYENNELLYTIEQLVPNWEHEEMQLNSGAYFED